jgi:hypothetical protein
VLDSICAGDVDNSQETLVAFLELAMVEELDGNNGRLRYGAAAG